jgi:hypothetical protein
MAKKYIINLNLGNNDLEKLNEIQLNIYNNFIDSNNHAELELLFEISDLKFDNKMLLTTISHQNKYYKTENQCLRDKYAKSSRKNENLLNGINRIYNSKPYRLAYFLRRFSMEFVKGSSEKRKNYIKWVLYKFKGKTLDHNYNVLYKLKRL